MLGTAIASRRKQLGLSQEGLAEQVGVSQGTIAQIELGMTKWPKLETLQAIARVLQSSITSLLRDAGYIEVDAEIEEEIAELSSQVPEFAELLQIALDVHRNHPEELRDIVSYAKWTLEKKKAQRGGSSKQS